MVSLLYIHNNFGTFKRLLPILLILSLIFIVPVNAELTTNFQTYGADGWGYSYYNGAPAITTSAEMVYLVLSVQSGSITWRNTNPQPSNYFAFTNIFETSSSNPNDVCGCYVRFYDANLNSLGGDNRGGTCSGVRRAPNTRVEYVRDAGTGVVTLFENGVNSGTIGTFATAPSYIEFYSYAWGGYRGTEQWSIDDIHIGDLYPKYYMSTVPADYYVVRDFVNPANSGLYKNGTNIRTTYMESRYARGYDTTAVTQIQLINSHTGMNYETLTLPDTHQEGTLRNNLSVLTDPGSTAPTGQYELNMVTVGGGEDNHAYFWFTAYGATLDFDQDTYGIGDTATVSATITDTYYNASRYTYKIKIQDVYGTEKKDEAVSIAETSPHSGTIDYSFGIADDPGVYYALLYAVEIVGGTEILLTYDTCETTGYFSISGYVFDAPTAAILPNAIVSVTQNGATTTDYSGYDGNYTTGATLLVTYNITIHANATGYRNYTHTFTPLRATALQINLTLVPDTPTYTGVAIGGVARTPPYNRTINSATITLRRNVTNVNETVTTNSVGYYVKNALPPLTLIDIWGSKTGFFNSTMYQVTT